jgi:SAM-dependent methyltransferase
MPTRDVRTANGQKRGMPSYSFPAMHLPFSSGELVNGALRADSNVGHVGNLTYGPYIALESGRYAVEIEFAGSADSSADIGAWDVFVGARGGMTLGRGALPDTGGRVTKLRAEFEVPPILSAEKLEVRTFFHGFGWLDVRSIRIDDYAEHTPPVDFGDLRRSAPFSTKFGFDRGVPVDRFYIVEFLASYASDIKGRVLEAGDRRYTTRFGGRRVKISDVLAPVQGNACATIFADLANAPEISDGTFDCVILTQVLLFIYDLRAAMTTIHRILTPGGVALLTLPSITRVEQDWARPSFWGFTGASAKRLAEDVFGVGQAEVSIYGNVLSATAFLYGLSFHELREEELRHLDPNYQVIIGIKAVKAPQPESS